MNPITPTYDPTAGAYEDGPTARFARLNAYTLGYTSCASRSGPTGLPLDFVYPDAVVRYRDCSDESTNHTVYELPDRLIYLYLWKDSSAQIQASVYVYSDQICDLPDWISTVPDVSKDVVKVRFWNSGHGGASMTARTIDAPVWADIRHNYSAPVLKDLDRLNNLTPDSDLGGGKLILWSGLPGTGKTYAIRALAQSWRKWADVHYIIDPENFLASPDYMMQAMIGDSHDWGERQRADAYKLIVLEDAGELVAIDARVQVGQALSRLLNVTEGMVGQGLRVFFLLTTNEELGKLHPAIIRSGRCFSNVKFKPLTADESNEWIGEKRFTQSQSLADLYAARNEAVLAG